MHGERPGGWPGDHPLADPPGLTPGRGSSPPAAAGLAAGSVLDAVTRWSASIADAIDPRAAAGDLLAVIAESLGATRGSLMIINPATARLHIVAGLALPEGCVGEDLPPAPRRISDWVAREG